MTGRAFDSGLVVQTAFFCCAVPLRALHPLQLCCRVGASTYIRPNTTGLSIIFTVQIVVGYWCSINQKNVLAVLKRQRAADTRSRVERPHGSSTF